MPTGAITLDRTSWLGYRRHGHGLDTRTADLADLLLLGIQDGAFGGARESLRGRVDAIEGRSIETVVSPEGPLVSSWSVRGAPHVHRLDDLAPVRDAMAPRDGDEGGPGYRHPVRCWWTGRWRASVARPVRGDGRDRRRT